MLASRLTEWRDQAAAACNKPRNFIMRDDAVLDLSKLGADSPRPLIKKDLFIRTLHPRAVQNYAPRLLQLLKAPVTDEQMDECTKLVAKQVQERSGTRQEQAKIKSVLSLSQAYYAVLCQTVAVEPSLVASDAELKDLISAVITGAIEIEHGQDGSLSVSTPSSNRLLSGWRYEVSLPPMRTFRGTAVGSRLLHGGGGLLGDQLLRLLGVLVERVAAVSHAEGALCLDTHWHIRPRAAANWPLRALADRGSAAPAVPDREHQCAVGPGVAHRRVRRRCALKGAPRPCSWPVRAPCITECPRVCSNVLECRIR